jgi:hypothetical protein
MSIRTIPDFFALEYLARSLWRNGETRGAALLVGAGLSRFAKLAAADTPRPPLWRDLRKHMAARIYPGVADKDVPADPLRLAEEYQALLGRVALDDFIRSQVPDRAWTPGDFDDALLRFPWSDVLTTNWDSLLERASQSIAERSYEIVSATSDIARAKSPRIIKLHGSVPSGPFIFTEDDYRTYPVRYAPFVNLARQIFLENELCLIGFSGSDPNFLQWSGWVRDNLGASTRRIYLVGVLNLHPAARRLLEARNVAPIDLTPLVAGHVGEERHAVAMKQFLDFLREAEPKPPHSWTPKGYEDPQPKTIEDMQRRFSDKPYAAALLDAAATRWQTERECYPGWIVCPYGKRGDLRRGTDATPMPSAEIMAHISQDRRARVLYELTWRFDTAFWPIPQSLFDLFSEIAEPKDGSGLSKDEHLAVAIILLRTARENGDQQRFDQLAQLVEKYSEPGTDFRAALSYQKSLWSRDRLDFLNLSKELQQVAGLDPIWSLRRAGLHCELGEYSKANDFIMAALNDLRARQQRDRNSLWVLSRRAWAQFLDEAADMGARFVGIQRTKKIVGREDWPLEFRAAKSDPWDELKNVEDAIEAAQRNEADKTFDPKVHFDAGTYTEQGEGIHFQSWTVESPSYALDRLADDAGIPIDFGWVTVLRAPSRTSVALQFQPTVEWYFRLLRTLRSHTDEAIERFFSRAAVARLSGDAVSALLDKLVKAVEFWRHRSMEINPGTGKKQFVTGPIEKIRLYLEVISRLAIRVDPVHARQLYDFALGIMKEPEGRHWWLFEPLDHLLQRSGEAMPRNARAELVLSAVEFPLQSEIGIAAPVHHWPAPVSHIAGCPLRKPADIARWTLRVRQLIDAVRTGNPASRADAALRLCYLDDAGLLQPDERETFGKALWAQQDDKRGLPAGTNLVEHVFLHLPAADADAVRRYFIDILYKAQGNELLNEASLAAITGAATPTKQRSEVIRPAHVDALRILDALLTLKPSQTNELGADMMRKRVSRCIGPVLTKAIMPALNPDDFTDERVEQLFRLIDSAPVPSAIGSLAVLVGKRPDCEDRAVRTIRRAIVGRSRDEISGAVTAIDSWLSLTADTNHAPPGSLVAQVVAAVANRREPQLGHLIWCARRLLVAGLLSSEQIASLVEALGDLLEETKYDQPDWTGPRAISMSVIRTECVKLAKDLANRGLTDKAITDWIEIGQTDPLPEIRWSFFDHIAGSPA